MDVDLDRRRARLGVGELSDFAIGPRDSAGGAAGLWRAQLGTRWHGELRMRTAAEHPGAEFEVPIEGEIFHRGWSLALGGRIDQLVRTGEAVTLREIKTVTRSLPVDEGELRADYPAYFAQAAAYLALRRAAGGPLLPSALGAELVFVETDLGLTQVVAIAPCDDALFQGQLERVAEFLELRLRARERLAGLRFRPAFERLRPGQESVQAVLSAAVRETATPVAFEAPTGFGKTGVLLECALEGLRAGAFERVLFLTGKSTGQIQVGRTLEAMTPDGGLAVWLVRPKAEHCVNSVFHCVRECCGYLDRLEERWPASGLARFYLRAGEPRDIAALRDAGRGARICPYEITRAALAGNDVWIGDYNYVFSPSASGLFYGQPGFDPGRTLLLVDEAHNLPSRAADAHSHAATEEQAREVLAALRQVRSPAVLLAAWEEWMRLLEDLEPVAEIGDADRDALLRIVSALADVIATVPIDYAAIGPRAAELLWQIPQLAAQLGESELPFLCWSPRRGTLALTCLDAAAAIGARLREFSGVILASATHAPPDTLAAALGLAGGESPSMPRPAISWVRARTPWRDGAYDVAFDLRVDTTFQQRANHHATTARTVAAFSRGAPVAVFFSSYAYAEAIQRAVEREGMGLRLALQPRLPDLAAQAAWLEDALSGSDALFLVLGSSFAESVDLLGGRVGRGMVVGPALPEVNAVQRARMEVLAAGGRPAAFRRVYQVPGMQKVNQALGRLVRAPGQRAQILLHCRRFAEQDYCSLLAPEYREGQHLRTDADLDAWLGPGGAGGARLT